jgi:hypothetical protein
MDIDSKASCSTTSPLAYLEHQEAAAPAELKQRWTQIRTQYERK